MSAHRDRKTGLAAVYDVCVITTFHPPMEARIYARCTQAYLRAGLSVCLVSPWPVPAEVPQHLRWETVAPTRGMAKRLIGAAKIFLRALRCGSRVYHFHDLNFLPWAVLLRLVTRSRVIYDCHEHYKMDILYNKEYLPKRLRRPVAIVTDAVETLCARLIGNAIVTVPAWEARFRRHGVRVTTIHNFTRWTIMRDLPHDAGIVYSGSLTRTYGFSMLLDIARILKKDGNPLPMFLTEKSASAAIHEELHRAVREEGLAIVVVPRLPPPEISQLMRRGSVGISVMQDSPEKRASISAKLFEYMAFGLPVVAEDFGYSRTIVTESGCGVLVAPTDAEGFVSAIRSILSDRNRYARYRENGFAALESLYSWEREERRLIDFYRAVRRGVA